MRPIISRFERRSATAFFLTIAALSGLSTIILASKYLQIYNTFPQKLTSSGNVTKLSADRNAELNHKFNLMDVPEQSIFPSILDANANSYVDCTIGLQ